MSVQFSAHWIKNPHLGWDKTGWKGRVALNQILNSRTARQVRQKTSNAIVITERRMKNTNGEDVFVLTTRLSEKKMAKAGLKPGSLISYNTHFTLGQLKEMSKACKYGGTDPEFKKFLNVVLDQDRSLRRVNAGQ